VELRSLSGELHRFGEAAHASASTPPVIAVSPFATSMAANQAVQALIQEKVLAVAQAVEDSLDDELHRLDKLTEDDLDGLRRKRIEQMRLAAKRKQQWLERGHGSYIDVTDEKVCVPPAVVVPRANALAPDQGADVRRVRLLSPRRSSSRR
jgi:hypothetical protein